MASVTITLQPPVCDNHLTFTVTGAASRSVKTLLGDLNDPVSDDEAVAFCKVIGKLAKSGRTKAQAAAILEAGITVTV